jgi:hypothetical protein
VLGLAVRDALPGWTIELVDRDALSVGFANWNAERLGFDDRSVTCTLGLGVDMAPNSGCDLVLWNVPGKAGDSVLHHLTLDVANALADGGLAALVAVNPLADMIRGAFAQDSAIRIEVDSTHAEHTVIHARREGRVAPAGDPFERGVFDRKMTGFGVDDFDYDITPVVGIPEFDTYSFATQLTFDLLRMVEDQCGSALVMGPGQGHVPLVVANQFEPDRLVLIDRDQLSLRASGRALVDVGRRVPRIEIVPAADLSDVPIGQRFSLTLLMLEDHARNDIHLARLEDLGAMVEPGGTVIVSGSSSVVSRFLAFAAKADGWKVRDRVKRSGASSARLERVN